MMRTLATCLLLLATMTCSAAAMFDDPALRARYQTLTHELRCVICLNESIATSTAPLARQMRDMVADKLRAGYSDKQIRQTLVDRYGTFVLYDPPFSPATWLLWLGPIPLIIFALGLGLALLRRKNRNNRVLSTADRERLNTILQASDDEDHHP